MLLVVLLNWVNAPDDTVHAPVPTTGLFEASVTLDILAHIVWFEPATDAVAVALMFIAPETALVFVQVFEFVTTQ